MIASGIDILLQYSSPSKSSPPALALLLRAIGQIEPKRSRRTASIFFVERGLLLFLLLLVSGVFAGSGAAFSVVAAYVLFLGVRLVEYAFGECVAKRCGFLVATAARKFHALHFSAKLELSTHFKSPVAARKNLGEELGAICYKQVSDYS